MRAWLGVFGCVLVFWVVPFPWNMACVAAVALLAVAWVRRGLALPRVQHWIEIDASGVSLTRWNGGLQTEIVRVGPGEIVGVELVYSNGDRDEERVFARLITRDGTNPLFSTIVAESEWEKVVAALRVLVPPLEVRIEGRPPIS